MEETKGNDQYYFHNIILLESVFKRERIVTLDANFTESTLDLEISNEIDKTDSNKFIVFLSVQYSNRLKNKGATEQLNPEIFSVIKMAGTFEKRGEPKLTFDQFASTNAPAMMFPFIREHLASMSLKAALPPILIQPVDFVSIPKKGNLI